MSRKHLPAAVPVSIGCSVRIKYRFGGYGPLLINHLSPQAEFSSGSVRGFFAPSQVVVSHEPSRSAVIQYRRSTFRAGLRTFQKEWSCERIELSWALR